MRITLITGIQEERYQLLCSMLTDPVDYAESRGWSDMVDIDSEPAEVHDYEMRPLVFIRPAAAIMHNHQPGVAIGDLTRISRADFS